MRRDFLKNLGIEDKETIDKILDENSSDIGRAKGEVDTLKTRVADLERDVANKDTEINTLKGQVGDTNALNQKIIQLETDKTNLTNELNTKVTAIQKDHAIESGVRDAKAKNIKAVIAQLDLTKITFENGELAGLSEQLETLKSDENTSFLFGDGKSTPPAGTKLNDPPNNGGAPSTTNSFAEAVAKALNKSN